MRYEARHNYFKKLAQNIGNFINISWTLAYRYQLLQCYHHTNGDSLLSKEMDIGPGMPMTWTYPFLLQQAIIAFIDNFCVCMYVWLFYKSRSALNPTDKGTCCFVNSDRLHLL